MKYIGLNLSRIKVLRNWAMFSGSEYNKTTS